MEYDKAYFAVFSLKSKIQSLVHNCDDSVILEILEFAGGEVESFEEFAKGVLEKLESRLFTDIEDAASSLEKALDSFFSVSQSESRGDGIQISMNLKQEVGSFSERVKTIKAKMEEYDGDDSSRSGKKPKMVGLSDPPRELVHWARNCVYTNVAIYGMAGIGKTTLAKEFFHDQLGLGFGFDCRAWVTVGQNPQLKEIIRSILDQVNPDSDKMLMEGDENISEYLKVSLRGRRYLIVIDDVWDEWVVEEMCCLLPDYKNSSAVLYTTRLEAVTKKIWSSERTFMISRTMQMRLLDKEESWNLLCEKVFGKEPCPYQLEEAGKKIAERCDGLPLTIVTVADLLSKAEKTPQYWSEIATQKNHQLFMAAYSEISEVLVSSYERLPKILQMCFLYMGIFPQYCKISQSKLIKMWCSDGFLEQNVEKSSNHDSMVLNDYALGCLQELVSNSVVMIYQSIIDDPLVPYTEKVKAYRLHSSFWHLSSREARKTNFFYILSSANEGLEDVIKEQHRLSFHNNILLGIKDVYESVEDNCASTAQSLLFYGPYLQYQVPICFSLKLLKQLDALAIRFYVFPLEILQLVKLRYLALTVNGKLPASICQLSNLQVLIVGRHMSIKSGRAPSYLPVEIWSIKELQHLQVMGCDLPDPPCGASLESLSALSDVSPLSCTEVILKAIPNLEKLGIRVELAPGDDGKPLNYFDNIFYLESLKSLKCVLENPEVALPLASLSIFSSCLERLSLSGLGYSWEEMSKLSLLPSLKVLKLRNYAFRGPKWEMEGGFSSLCSLLIEDTDLEEWKIGAERFRNLNYLIIRNCYKLEKIHGRFENLRTIEVIDCNPLGVKQMEIRKPWLWTTVVKFSWNDGN